MAVKDIDVLFEKAKPIGNAIKESKGRYSYLQWYYWETKIKGETSYIHIVELRNGEFRLYHIGDSYPEALKKKSSN